jgi:hypothetical protein
MGLELARGGRGRGDVGELRDATGLIGTLSILGSGSKMRVVVPRSNRCCRNWRLVGALLGRGVRDSKDRVGTTTSGGVLGLGQDVVLNIANLVPAVDIGNCGMVESLRCVPLWPARSRVVVGAVMIHYSQVNERRLNASLTAKMIKKSNRVGRQKESMPTKVELLVLKG